MRSAAVYILLALACAFSVVTGQRNCPTICPLIFDPKCGFNGNCYQQFSNACDLTAANCRASRAFKQVDLALCQKASSGRGGLRSC